MGVVVILLVSELDLMLLRQCKPFSSAQVPFLSQLARSRIAAENDLRSATAAYQTARQQGDRGWLHRFCLFRLSWSPQPALP